MAKCSRLFTRFVIKHFTEPVCSLCPSVGGAQQEPMIKKRLQHFYIIDNKRLANDIENSCNCACVFSTLYSGVAKRSRQYSTTLKNLTLIKLHYTKQYTLDFTIQGGQTLSTFHYIIHECRALYSQKSRAFGQGFSRGSL